MENNNSQLQTTVTTPVTNTITDVSVPTDLAETNLAELQNTFNQAGSNFNLMGEALAKDVNARQQLLIGNNFGPTSGSAVGDLNYDTYYEQGLAKGANAIRQEGTKIALSEGMRRAQDKAKKRAEKAQKDYNDRVAAANARAAAAAAAAQSSAPSQATNKGTVEGVQLSPETLKKYGVSSAADLARTNRSAFEREMKLAADSAVGINNANVWKHGTSHWYGAVDEIYNRFGANEAQRQDERSGSKSKESQDFWKRKDVGDAFSQLMLSKSGYSSNYYQDRNRWVGDVAGRVYALMERGGTIDQINKELGEVRVSFSVKETGNSAVLQQARSLGAVGFADDKRFKQITDAMSKEDAAELTKIREVFRKAEQDASQGGSEEERASRAAAVFSNDKFSNGASGEYNRALELMSKSGIGVFAVSNKNKDKGDYFLDLSHLGGGAGISYVKKANVGEDSRRTITLDGSSMVSGTMGLTAKDINGIYRWKTEDPSGFARAVDINARIMSNPLDVSDGSLVREDGSLIPAGTAVIYSYKGSEEMESYKRLKELMESKPVIYSDGSGSYGFVDVDGLGDYYDAYIQDVSRRMNLGAAYFGDPDAGTGKGASFIASRDKSSGLKASSDEESENATLSTRSVAYRLETTRAMRTFILG